MKDIELIKQTKINGELKFKEINYYLAKKIIIENHYSKKWNNSFGKINIGIFKDNILYGCASFGNMMNTESYKSISNQINKNQILELNRMWIDDYIGRNAESLLISSSIKLIKKINPEIKLIQSFADGRLGCGTIYKASNFKYYGYSESKFFENIETGECYHKAPFEVTNRPHSFLEKNKLYLDNKLKCFLVKTYRYIYQIDTKINIDLKEEKYPEYEKGIKYVEFIHSDSLLHRLYIMYNSIQEYTYAEKAFKLIKTKDIKSLNGKTMKNKSVIDFLNKYRYKILANDY